MAAARPSVMARSRTGSGPGVSPAVLVVLGYLLMMIAATTAGPGYRSEDQLANGVCQSMDIRGNAEFLNRLKNCTVIEGQLNIVLMEKSSNSTFENLSFPKLREVTGYIQIYRLKGLTSLGTLFPNLAVIRGMSLFRDYALVIYDNENLQSLGLRSLTRVERGAVRIENNNNLCYANTIDWSRIVAAGPENVILRNNYDSRLCGLCKNAEGRQVGMQSSSQQCPSDSNGRLLCWDDKHCQISCPASCGDRACMSDGQCCDYSCLGGCSGTTSRDCHVCRHLSMGYEEERVCIDRCPKGTFQLLRRCVSQEECHRTPAPRDAPDAMTPDRQKRYYKTLNDTCIYNCPAGYMEMGESNNTVCVPCPIGGCVRECAGGKIDSLAAAERFRGCTHVKGNIEIEIKSTGSNTMADLEANLGEVREIEGALKVIRAQPLVTLSFLKSLRKIVGHTPNGTKKQPLYIFNNPNLELLWNWETHGPIEITEGVLFIHFNPKLCYHLIAPLKNMTRDPASTFGDLEVSLDSNGDQAICSQETMSINVTTIFQAAAIISWSTYCLDDPRKLLGYSIYYTVAETNITQYERRDACNDNWSVIDVPWDDTNGTTASDGKGVPGTRIGTDIFQENCSKLQPRFKPLTQLIPFTRYAVYVKTYTTMKGKSGAKSPIVYFKTLPGRPSQPLNVQVESVDAHSVYIRWSPPLLPNGTLAMYRIEIHKNEYNRQQVLHIDHCNNPTAIQTLMPSRKEDSPSSKYSAGLNKGSNGTETGSVKDDSCSCKDQSPTTRFTSEMEAEHADSIAFENALQNHVYRKRPRKQSEHIRVRRGVDNSLVILSNSTDPILNVSYPNETDSEGYLETAYVQTDGRTTHVTVGSLRHYTWYTVSIWACRERNGNETLAAYNTTWCSVRTFETFRTADMANADVVSRVRAEVITSNKTLPEVNVTWDPPGSPNGFVVAYRVHHARVEDDSVHELEHLSCLSAGDYEAYGGGFVLRNLAPGNYSVKVTPVTVGGPGNASTEIFVFIPSTATSAWQWAWGVAGAALAVFVAIGAGGWWARRTISTADNKLIASVNPEYSSAVYVPDDWEVPRTSIELLKELGQGSFGMVYEGIARSIVKGQPETRCAVKTVNEHATDRERIEFLNEASVMKAFDTHHVVRLLGVVSRGQPTLVVMELMQLGDLKSYLRSHRPDQDGGAAAPQPPTLNQIYQMAIEIADGMSYLSAKKFVHRDLAARNCMVAEDMTVKIGDFGMTRDIYETDYYRKGSKGLLPVRWMSPESLKDGVFSSSSDVWSYGVVLWEMATLAMQPYQGLSNEQVLRYVVEGGVMERPEHCPDRLYDLMRACWAHRPNHRPSFLRLVADLAPIAANHFRHRSFFHTAQGQELYAQQRINMVQVVGDGCIFSRSFVKKPELAMPRLSVNKEEVEPGSVSVGAVVTGSGSNLFGVSGRLASWVRDLSSLRSRGEPDAAAEPLAPRAPPQPLPLKAHSPPANGRIHPTTPC